MLRAADVVETHDLSGIIDPEGQGGRGARDVDRGEDALVQEKTVLRTADIYVEARDLAAIIDPEGCGERGARDINRSEGPPVQQKAMERAPGICEPTHDLAVSIDEVVRVFIIFLSGCDICPARLFFRAGINVLLPSKAEIPSGTRHGRAKYFLHNRHPSHPVFQNAVPLADDTDN